MRRVLCRVLFAVVVVAGAVLRGETRGYRGGGGVYGQEAPHSTETHRHGTSLLVHSSKTLEEILREASTLPFERQEQPEREEEEVEDERAGEVGGGAKARGQLHAAMVAVDPADRPRAIHRTGVHMTQSGARTRDLATSAACYSNFLSWAGDGWCDDLTDLNSAVCDYEGGDCCTESCVRNASYTCGGGGYNCVDPRYSGTCSFAGLSVNTTNLGDGKCDKELNTEDCEWDSGDCCEETCVSRPHTCGGVNGTYDSCQDPFVSNGNQWRVSATSVYLTDIDCALHAVQLFVWCYDTVAETTQLADADATATQDVAVQSSDDGSGTCYAVTSTTLEVFCTDTPDVSNTVVVGVIAADRTTDDLADQTLLTYCILPATMAELEYYGSWSPTWECSDGMGTSVAATLVGGGTATPSASPTPAPSPSPTQTIAPSKLPSTFPTRHPTATNNPTMFPTHSVAPTTQCAAVTTSAPTTASDAQEQFPFCELLSSAVCVGNYRYLQQTENGASAWMPVLTDSFNFTFLAFQDLDGDKALDLAVGTETMVLFFRNVGNSSAPALEQVTGDANPFHPINELCNSVCFFAPALFDADADGDLDCLLGTSDFDVPLFWKNNGNATQPRFVAQPDTVFENGRIAYVSGSERYGTLYPAAVDIDADGDVDVVIGTFQTQLLFYANVGNASVANFTRMDNSELNPFNGLSSDLLFLASHFVDVDNDGDLDMVWGDLRRRISLGLNTGTPTHAIFADSTGTIDLLEGYETVDNPTPFTADMDGNGHPELYHGDAWGRIVSFDNLGSDAVPTLMELSDDYNPFELSSLGSTIHLPALADWNGDGLLDMVVSVYFQSERTVFLFYYENTNTADTPVMTFTGTITNLPLADALAPAPVDVNGDGWIDIVIGTNSGYLIVILSCGTRCFELVGLEKSPFPTTVSSSSAVAAAFADMDNDGDPDLLLGGNSSIRYFQNTGNAQNASFEERTGVDANPFYDVTFGAGESIRVLPTMADLDADGDFDLLLGGGSGEVAYYENVGTPECPLFTDTALVDLLPDTSVFSLAAPAFADVDNDSDIDILVGTFQTTTLWLNGRCFPDTPCSDNGVCADNAYYPSCSCLLGFTTQCADCLDGFYGTGCDLCPGAGTEDAPTLASVCSQRGVCDDGLSGTGVCTCNAPFSDTNCSTGSCSAGWRLVLNISTGLFECDECPEGTFKAEEGNDDSCTDCAPGYYSSGVGSTRCDPCPPGTFTEQTASSSCIACAEGHFADGNATIACTQCVVDNGMTTRSTGAQDCTACLAGWFWHSERETCEECDDDTMDCSSSQSSLRNLTLRKNHWRMSASSDLIEVCPYNNACSGGTGSGDDLCEDGYGGPLCAVCSSDYYHDSLSNQCKPCEKPTYSAEAIVAIAFCVVVVVVLAVYYLQGSIGENDDAVHCRAAGSMPIDTNPAHEDEGAEEKKGEAHGTDGGQNHTIHQRRAQASEATSGEENGSAMTITSLHSSDQGEVEDETKDDRAIHDREHADRGESTEHERAEEREHRRSVRTKMKILLNFLQIISSWPFVFDMSYPERYAHALGAISVVNLDLTVLPSECVWRTDFFDELVVMTLFPLVAIATVYIFYLVHYWCVRDRARGTRRLAMIQATYFGVGLFLSYLCFPSVSAKLFASYSCHTLDDESFLRADYSIDCTSPRYSLIVAWASFMMVLYPIGIPCLYLYLLWRQREDINPERDGLGNSLAPKPPSDGSQEWKKGCSYVQLEQKRKLDRRDELQQTDPRLRAIAFLTESYETNYWWWEVYECGRRLLLSSVLIVLLDDSAAQALVALSVALLTVFIHSYATPYVNPYDDRLQELMQCNLFIMMFTTLLFRVDVSDDDRASQDAYDAVLLVFLIVGVLLVVGVFLMELYKAAVAAGEEFADWLRGAYTRCCWTDCTAAPGEQEGVEMSNRTGNTVTSLSLEDENQQPNNTNAILRDANTNNGDVTDVTGVPAALPMDSETSMSEGNSGERSPSTFANTSADNNGERPPSTTTSTSAPGDIMSASEGTRVRHSSTNRALTRQSPGEVTL